MKPIAVAKKVTCAQSQAGRAMESSIGKPKKGYRKHLYRVLKQVHPDLTQWTSDLLHGDTIGRDDFGLIAAEAARLSHYNMRNTITSREIHSALRQLHAQGPHRGAI